MNIDINITIIKLLIVCGIVKRRKGVLFMKKEVYESPKMEIFYFDNEDVISVSGSESEDIEPEATPFQPQLPWDEE